MQDDLFDESDRRKADKAEILEDLKRFEEYIKLEKKYAHSKHIDPNALNMVTKWLREKADKRQTLQSQSERFTPISNKIPMYLYDYPYAISKDIVTESITDKGMVLSEQYLYYVS